MTRPVWTDIKDLNFISRDGDEKRFALFDGYEVRYDFPGGVSILDKVHLYHGNEIIYTIDEVNLSEGEFELKASSGLKSLVLGDDYINTSDDRDVVSARTGDDEIHTNGGDDVVYGGKGNDYIVGEEGNDKLLGNKDNDTLIGSLGEDTIYGGKGNDKLYGDEGDDFLSGDLGLNDVWGGDGFDVFSLKIGEGYTVIHDFADGVDQIRLASGTSAVTLASEGNDVRLFQQEDLIAIVKNVEGQLQQDGFTIV